MNDDLTIDSELKDDKSSSLTGSMKENLSISFLWMKVVSIIGLSLLGLATIIYLFSLIRLASYGFGGGFGVQMLIFLLITTGEILLIVLLLKASIAYKKYEQTGQSSFLEEAFKKQKQFWLISGIVTIVVVAIYLFAILIFSTGSWRYF